MVKYARSVVIQWGLQPAVMFLLLAMSVDSLSVVLVMSMSAKMVISPVHSARLVTKGRKVCFVMEHNLLCSFLPLIYYLQGLHVAGSPRVDGDDDEDDVDDLENEFNYAKGKGAVRHQWRGEDLVLSSSSRHESQHPIPLLTNSLPVGY